MDLTYNVSHEPQDAALRQKYWQVATGLQKVDNLTPSSYMEKLISTNIAGNISNSEIKSQLTKYYSEQVPTTKKVSDEREADLVSARIFDLLSDNAFTFNHATLRSIHGYLFQDIYDFAGQYRTVNITKSEPILNGQTVNYASAQTIETTLTYVFDQEKTFNLASLQSLPVQAQHFAKFTSDIWQIHPFMEGNTRTTAVFIEKYLRSLGFKVDNTLFATRAVDFRNALVLANYTNVTTNTYADPSKINDFFTQLLK